MPPSTCCPDLHSPSAPEVTLPPRPAAAPRLGIIGGGQLARLTALAALPLGCEVVVLERHAGSPGARVAPGSVVGDWGDPEVLARFAEGVDVVTLENEFVPADLLRGLEAQGIPVFPTAASLAVTQDKFIQKSTLAAAGLPVPEFTAVSSVEDIAAAAGRLGWPVVVKARCNGYDGKGNGTVRTLEDIPAVWRRLGGGSQPLMVEAFWPYRHELAVIVTRGRAGEEAVYPVVETVQRDHVCREVVAPAGIAPRVAERAAALARRAVAAVGGIGSFGVELFLGADGALAINELAPRVHNSGHYTIEACACSQFANHVRAVLGWPLGSPELVRAAAAMVNLIGERAGPGRVSGLPRALAVPGAQVHLYAKSASAPGRKLGHVTALGDTPAAALELARRAARELSFGGETT